MCFVVMDQVRRDGDVRLRSLPHRLRRVEVSVEAREVAASDVKPESVSGLEDVARFPEAEDNLVNRVRLEPARFCKGVAIACPHHRFGNENRAAIGVDIRDRRKEIGVGNVCLEKKTELDSARNFQVLGERLRRVDEDVLALLVDTLVQRTVRRQAATTATTTSISRHWIARIVAIGVGPFVAGPLSGEPTVTKAGVRSAVTPQIEMA